MKCVVAICLLATLLVSSTARVSPGFSDWHRLAKPHSVGDIWKDCSKLKNGLQKVFMMNFLHIVRPGW